MEINFFLNFSRRYPGWNISELVSILKSSSPQLFLYLKKWEEWTILTCFQIQHAFMLKLEWDHSLSPLLFQFPGWEGNLNVPAWLFQTEWDSLLEISIALATSDTLGVVKFSSPKKILIGWAGTWHLCKGT
jgi:hypothetical protein